MSAKLEVVEAYRDYVPSFDVRRSVLRLLSTVDERHTHGIRAVVLTNIDALSRQVRRRKTKSRGRKIGLDQVAGLYHPAWKGELAWIELFIDQILDGCPRWVLRFPVVRDTMLAQTLFHEIGHHIHKTQAPVHDEQEDVADAWTRRLGRQYFPRVYWYLVPVFRVLVPAYKWVRRLQSRLAARRTGERSGSAAGRRRESPQ